MKKTLFYALSVIWGFPMTLVGFAVAFVLTNLGYQSKKHGFCYYFEVGNAWGGVNLGIVVVTSKNPTTHTLNHEHGHALQNCIWGPLMPFVISLPSAARYWSMRLKQSKGEKLEPYDSIWFEGQASEWGELFVNSLEAE